MADQYSIGNIMLPLLGIMWSRSLLNLLLHQPVHRGLHTHQYVLLHLNLHHHLLLLTLAAVEVLVPIIQALELHFHLLRLGWL